MYKQNNKEVLKSQIKYFTELIEQHKKQKATALKYQSQPHSTTSYNKTYHLAPNRNKPIHQNLKWVKSVQSGTVKKNTPTTPTDKTYISKNPFKLVKNAPQPATQPHTQHAIQTTHTLPPQTHLVKLHRSRTLRQQPTAVRSALKSRYQKNNRLYSAKQSKYKFCAKKNFHSKTNCNPKNKVYARNMKSPTSKDKLKLANRKQYLARRVVHRSQLKYIASKKRRTSEKFKLYCLFYISFGKCKRGNSCSFVHDRSRIALCPRMLRGSCKEPKCLLSHTITKDKIPVCSFFLLNKCNLNECPYMHVNVGPDAEICEDFALKGRCKEADKCSRKHVRCCPNYYETNTCNQRSCHLVHYFKNIENVEVLTKRLDAITKLKNNDLPQNSPARKEKDTDEDKPCTSSSLPLLPDFISISSSQDTPSMRIKPRINFRK